MTELNPLIIELLKKRGVTSSEDIEEFLSDKPQKTYDPALLADIEEGANLLLCEIAAGAKICIYGDYDADGITSTTLMLSVLGHIVDEGNLDYYIPSRFEEGYGLNKDAIKVIWERGFDVIVTVDCGSVSFEEVEYAKELGMKVVVTDHHTVTDKMPNCPVINPKRPDSQYPFKELAGCGVAFKFAQVIQKKAGLPKQILTEVLDLVAIGTIGDIMPLVDENRTLAKFGIKIINTGRRPGLDKLIRETGLTSGHITSENISYVIVPHLNATGRIEDASEAVELLRIPTATSDCGGNEKIETIVNDLVFKNQQRKRLQQETFKSCIDEIDSENPDAFIMIKSENAHEGIAGIVAGKIKETFYRPAIIVTPSGDEGRYLKGTGRSIEGVNLYELLKNHEELFEKFGGHAGACGFLMKSENFQSLKAGLNEDMEKLLDSNEDLFEKKYDIDLELPTEDISIQLAENLELLAPFGNHNPKPLFVCQGIAISDVKYMGNEEQHVRFTASGRNGGTVQCVMFNKAKEYGRLLFARRLVSIIGTVECQTWQGNKRLQFMVDEII